MKIRELIQLVRDEPVFTTDLLKIPGIKPSQIRLQLVRWVKAGRLIQYRRGVYAFAGSDRKMEPHPFLVANAMNKASYVSLQSALAWYGLIPEYVPGTTSVTAGRPEELQTKEGLFIFRHVKKAAFTGYRKVEVAVQQEAIVATPEKALVDLLYLMPHSDTEGCLEELRLQNDDSLDAAALKAWAQSTGSRKTIWAIQLYFKVYREGRDS